MTVKYKGIVTTFFPNKKYGFILADADRSARFFHLNNLVEGYRVKIGDRVEFKLGTPVRLGQPDQAVDVAPQGSKTPKVGEQ